MTYMRFFQDGEGSFNSTSSFVTSIDSHTEGETTRLIVDGMGEPPGRTMMEKLAYFKTNYITRIKGRAWITGLHRFYLSFSDPFKKGYLL